MILSEIHQNLNICLFIIHFIQASLKNGALLRSNHARFNFVSNPSSNVAGEAHTLFSFPSWQVINHQEHIPFPKPRLSRKP